MFSNKFRGKNGATVSNKYQIQLKKVFAAAKIQKNSPYVFCKRRPARASTGAFLSIMQNPEEYLF